MTPKDHDVRDPEDMLGMVRRRWRLLLSVIAVCVLVGAGLSSLQSSLYTADATVLVQSPAQLDSPGRAMDAEEVATQADVVTSDAVTKRVIDDLGLDVDSDDLRELVAVDPVDDKRILTVQVTWSDAEGAADIANGLVDTYVDVAGDRALAAQAAVTDSYVERLSVLETEIEKLREEWPGAEPGRRLDIRAEITSLRARQAELQTSLLLAADPLSFTSGGDVLTQAQAPGHRSAPQPLRAGALGGAIGLVLGLLLVYLRDRRDDNVRSGQPLPPGVQGVPVLAHVPVEHREVENRVVSVVEPFSPVAEAYRSLSTSVRFLLAAQRDDGQPGSPSRSGRVVMVGSANPLEGKTSVATNLAVAAARSGLRVLLVDADLRSPGLGDRFGIDSPTGLTDVLRDSSPPAEHVVDAGVEGLRVLLAGPLPPNPAELLASPRCAQLWQELSRHADLVVVDTPPALRVPDAMEVAGHSDVVVLVARERTTRGRDIALVQRRLQRVGAPLSGLVITGAPLKRSEFHQSYGQVEREMV